MSGRRTLGLAALVAALLVAACGPAGPKVLRVPAGNGAEWVVTDTTGRLVSIADNGGIPPGDLGAHEAVRAIEGRGDAVRLWLWQSPCPIEIRVGLANDGAGMTATVQEEVSCGNQSANLRILKLVFDGPVDADAITITDLGNVPEGG